MPFVDPGASKLYSQQPITGSHPARPYPISHSHILLLEDSPEYYPVIYAPYNTLPKSYRLEWGRDGVVGRATHYGLDGPRIECQWGRDFPHSSRPAVGPTQPPIQWVPGLFPRVKRPGRGADHPPSSSAEVKERVAILLLPLWAFVASSRVNFTFTFTYRVE